MANKVYTQQETAVTWTDSGGTYAMDLGGLAADAVRIGAQGDLGAAPRSDEFFWQLVIDGFDTAPVVDETVDLYLAFAQDTSDIDGDVGTADAAGATSNLKNLLHIGSAVVQTTTAANELIISGTITIKSRYVSPVVHNNTADALLSTADAHTFKLWPVPPEIQ